MNHLRVWRILFLTTLLLGYALSTSHTHSTKRSIKQSSNGLDPMDVSSDSSSSSSASPFSSSSSTNSYFAYAQTSSFSMPYFPIGYVRIAASRDPSQRERLFYLAAAFQQTVVDSIDMQTGQSLPSLNLTAPTCGFNVTCVTWFVPLSDSIMVYTETTTTDTVVIMQLNHTNGDCMRSWRVNSSLHNQQHFAVDERSQRFALYTVMDQDLTVLSLFSMETGNITATTSFTYRVMPVSFFDPYSGDYILGPDFDGVYTQVSGTDLSLVRDIHPFERKYAFDFFYDQAGSRIVLSNDLGYVYPNDVWNQFVSNGSNTWVRITSTLNHDVIALNETPGSVHNYSAYRFRQYPAFSSSSSSAPTISSSSAASSLPSSSSTSSELPSSASSTALFSSSSMLSSMSTASAESSSAGMSSSTGPSAGVSSSTGSVISGSSTLSAGLIAGIVSGTAAVVCLLAIFCCAYRRSRSSTLRSQKVQHPLLAVL